MNNSSVQKKVWKSIVAIILLFLMFIITTYALISSYLSVEDNLFETAAVDIDLNGGVPIFTESDFALEPGRSNGKRFTITNNSTVDVYYRLYLCNIAGDLHDALRFEIRDGDEVLYAAQMDEFDQETPFVSDEILKVGETRILTAVVIMDEKSGNRYQSEFCTFDVVANAIQVRNNPTKVFE